MSEDKTVNVKLTQRELWSAISNIEASFTDPDQMTEVDRSACDKLSAALTRARKRSDG